ncbi:MAG: FtsW/RodA/SpoVE family cell cycle protein [Kiritimatiellae bacterium]|nr:FtsW/RodA/SpoVE family cell cycle protein [Kiritimatiellia bacterium]
MRRFIREFNWISFLSMIALVAVGASVLASAGAARAEMDPAAASMAGKWKVMLGTSAVGLVCYFALAFSDYRKILDWTAYPAYGVALAFLALVLLCGSEQFGGRRWLWFFQPSETAKFAVIACLAHLYGQEGEQFAGQFRFRGFLVACAIVAVPCGLILLEPDLGTALTLLPAVTVMLLAAGVWRKGMVLLLAGGAVAATAVLGAVYEAERPGTPPARREAILKYTPLEDHQVARVKTFLFPSEDSQGDGYNLAQAKKTIAAGGIDGAGWGRGGAIRERTLPPKVSMNDFIFCVWAEEMGYVKGSLFLLALYGILCVSTLFTLFSASDGRGRLLVLGVVTLVFAHVYINIGMSIGLVPITGLPLPFLSLGRTFLVTVMCCLGLVQSVALHREES